jgi:hypothetical protein
LRYAAGDGQLAEAGGELAEPLVAEVIDGAGNLISNEPVNWRVRAGGGTLSAAETISDANGRVQATWVLGPEAGHNKSELFLENGASITFDATGMATTDDPAPAPPVVSKSWPPNGALLSARARRNRRQFEIWSEKPRIEFTFDQEMNEAQLDSVNPWLRVWQLQDKGEIVLRAVKLSRIDPLAERSKFTAAYALDNVDPDQAARYLVQVRSKEGNIISAGGLARQLDADFAGTKLTAAVLRKIWKIEEERTFGDRKVWDALVDTGKQLPSGDEAGGGVYHGWFAVGDGRNRLRRSDDR